MHTTGGYSVGTYLTTKWVFDLKEEDTYWCTADIGWVTGHSYIVYGPLQNGATSLMYEGAPNFPEPDRFWAIIDTPPGQHLLHRAHGDPHIHQSGAMSGPKKHKLDQPALAGHRWRAHQSRSVDVVSRGHRRQSLPDRRHLVADGNRAHHDRADSRRDCHQAGFGDAALSRRRARNCYDGWQARARWLGRLPRHQASPGPRCCAPSMAIPIAMCASTGRRFPGMYFTGDGARKDKDGYFWIMGRVDDVINVSRASLEHDGSGIGAWWRTRRLQKPRSWAVPTR